MTMRPQDRIRFDNLLNEARYASHANDREVHRLLGTNPRAG